MAKGYSCAAGFCGCAGPLPHHPAPQCGPASAVLRLGGDTPAEKVQLAKRWCDANASHCSGFAIDPLFAVTLAFSGDNLTATAQPNAAWSLFWRGPPQPLPPAPPPQPPPPPPPAWRPLLPRGPCASDADCSLNGRCVAGSCACHRSWEGHNCERLALAPLPAVAGYGEAPNVSSWGGSIYHNATTGDYHLFVTEETDGKGLASWVSNSQIIRAVSRSPTGPFERREVVSKPPTTNPQLLYDERSKTFLLFHIRGSGAFQLFTSGAFPMNRSLDPLSLGHLSPILRRFFPIFSPSYPQDSRNRHQDPETRSETAAKRSRKGGLKPFHRKRRDGAGAVDSDALLARQLQQPDGDISQEWDAVCPVSRSGVQHVPVPPDAELTGLAGRTRCADRDAAQAWAAAKRAGQLRRSLHLHRPRRSLPRGGALREPQHSCSC